MEDAYTEILTLNFFGLEEGEGFQVMPCLRLIKWLTQDWLKA